MTSAISQIKAELEKMPDSPATKALSVAVEALEFISNNSEIVVKNSAVAKTLLSKMAEILSGGGVSK